MNKFYGISRGKQGEVNIDVLKNNNIYIQAKSKSVLTVFGRNLLVSGIAIVEINVEKDARVNYVARNTDGMKGQIRLKVNLLEKKSAINIDSLFVGYAGNTNIDEIEINHQARETSSAFNGYSLVQNNSENVWKVTTVIENVAKKSVASQRINNLLLGEKGVVKNRPALIIRNNDVACSHSVATGHLDEEQLFYAQSRGLNTAQSRSMMARGFVEPVLKLLPKCVEQELGEKIDNLLTGFAQVAQPSSSDIGDSCKEKNSSLFAKKKKNY